MQEQASYFKVKSVFLISLLLIGLLSLSVYLVELEGFQSVSSKLYGSIALLGLCLFCFLTWGFYRGKELIDDFPKLRKYNFDWFFNPVGNFIRMDAYNFGDSVVGVLVAVIVWFMLGAIVLVIGFAIFLILCYLVFVILSMFYRLFYHALAFVLERSDETRANWGLSMRYALTYTAVCVLGASALVFMLGLMG